MKNIRKGRLCEQQALAFFEERGWRLVAQNQRVKGVEIDLILQKPSAFLLVEVKSDNAFRKDHPLSREQKQRLQKAFTVFCEQQKKPVYIQLAIVGKAQVSVFDLEF